MAGVEQTSCTGGPLQCGESKGGGGGAWGTVSKVLIYKDTTRFLVRRWP